MACSTDVAVRLRATYDAGELRRDLNAALAFRWEKQSPCHMPCDEPLLHHAGPWEGISLFGSAGRWDSATSGVVLEPYAETEILAHTSYFRSVLDSIPAPKFSSRLLSLSPTGIISTHTDSQIGFRFGMLRLHIPIVTDPKVTFLIGGERVDWGAGELWYGDFSLPHSVHNESPISRVHLVVDLAITDGLLRLFPADFIQRKAEEGILMYVPPVSMDNETLATFSCDFVSPAGFLSPNPHKMSVRVRPGGLVLSIEGKPAFSLEPIDASTFRPIGGDLCMFFVFRREGNRVETANAVSFDGHQMVVHPLQITGRG